MSFTITKRFLKNHPLTKNNLLAGYYRFFKWQILCRLHKQPFEYPFIEGTKLLVKKGMTGATGNIYAGLHEFEDMAFLLHLLRSEDMFADVGSNIGSYTILASGVVGAKSVAFEPVPSTYHFLKSNIEINNLQNISVPYNVGVGNEKGKLKFTNNFDTINHVVVGNEESVNTIEVDIITLNDVFLDTQIPALMKIDVEGFEKSVLQGANNILKNATLKSLIVELNGCCHKYGVTEDEIHQILLDYGFKTFHYKPFERELERTNNYNNGGNTIYIRDEEWVKQRIKSSKKYTVIGKSF